MKLRKGNIIVDTEFRNGEPMIINSEATVSEVLVLLQNFKDEYICDKLEITVDHLHEVYFFAVEYLINSAKNNTRHIYTLLDMGFQEVVE